ncbi:glycosyltransferase [Geoalkalibacter sp.]|uniref:glycosyltransferase n=1 Tax=Geoalkalibacter sp. TaxID=3041440 RepID=UPI00272EA843|nr:glycosyltransferase [Geoalkalibacter sp.]
MRFLILHPQQHAATGNRVTAERFRQGLAQRGHQVRLLGVHPGSGAPVQNLCRAWEPDAALLLHAFRSGVPWLASAAPTPFAVLLTGTDIHEGLDHPEQAGVIREVLQRAGAILAQAPQTVEALKSAFPEWAARLRHLPAGIHLGDRPFPLRKVLGLSPDIPVFLHPAGVRPVKGNLELLAIFAPLAASGPPFRLVFCGPVLDPDYGRAFVAEVARHPWAAYLGVVPPEAMPATLREADVVLNNSRSEGLSNVLIEAAVLGRPLLATAIAGNQAVIRNGINGYCCADAAEFTRRAEELLRDPELRRRLSQPRSLYPPDQESDCLEQCLVALADQPVSRA